MIVVDSSVWIDYFNGRATLQTDCLDEILQTELIAVGDLILAEVLQGFKNDTDYRTARKLLTSLPVLSLVNTDIAIKSADNFRFLRKRGITVRKTIDSIIATFCIENNHLLLFSDMDYLPFVKYLQLSTVLKL